MVWLLVDSSVNHICFIKIINRLLTLKILAVQKRGDHPSFRYLETARIRHTNTTANSTSIPISRFTFPRSSGVREWCRLRISFTCSYQYTGRNLATYRTDLSITLIGTKTPQRKHMERETILATPLKILLLGINIPIR